MARFRQVTFAWPLKLGKPLSDGKNVTGFAVTGETGVRVPGDGPSAPASEIGSERLQKTGIPYPGQQDQFSKLKPEEDPPIPSMPSSAL